MVRTTELHAVVLRFGDAAVAAVLAFNEDGGAVTLLSVSTRSVSDWSMEAIGCRCMFGGRPAAVGCSLIVVEFAGLELDR